MFWIVLCILNLLCPPLPVAMLRGFSGSFVVSVVLTILAWIPGIVFGYWCILQDYFDSE